MSQTIEGLTPKQNEAVAKITLTEKEVKTLEAALSGQDLENAKKTLGTKKWFPNYLGELKMNGYKNWETWNFVTHITNGQPDIEYAQHHALCVWEDAKGQDYEERSINARIELSKLLNEFLDQTVEEFFQNTNSYPKVTGTWLQDTIENYVQSIDWLEVADTIFDSLEISEYVARKEKG